MKTCKHCDGDLTPLGKLGNVTHYRCRMCGAESSHTKRVRSPEPVSLTPILFDTIPAERVVPREPLTVTFSDPEDRARFLHFVKLVKANEGTVSGLWAGLACCALKRSKIVS